MYSGRSRHYSKFLYINKKKKKKKLLTKLMKGKKLSVLGSLKLGGQSCVDKKASCAGI